ncbi:MAG: hypothetical protein OJF55_001922 [Rhodanobacteraceae bacterium]|jgi:hypothetical protein|nr:MAG: hypothetical protein OJF55_001922 [Rhodanobacteraceae bacterium]
MGACAVLGLLTGWLANGLPPPPSHLTESNAWNLPDKDALNRYHAADFQTLTQSGAWKPPAGTHVAGGSDEGTQPGGWKLVGIVTAAGPYALVLPQGGGTTQRLTIGEKLPDGATIRQINHESIEFVTAGCTQTRELFPVPGSSTARNQACKPAASGQQPPAAAGESHE